MSYELTALGTPVSTQHVAIDCHKRGVQFVALRVDCIFMFMGSGGGNRWKLYIFSHLQQVHQNTSVKH